MGACCVKDEDQSLDAEKVRRKPDKQELPINNMISMETAQSNIGNEEIIQ